jgi:hypothetical protein
MVAGWKLDEKELSRRLEELQARVNNRWVAYLDDLTLTGTETDDGRAKVRAAVRGLVKRVTVTITPRDRYNKSVSCVVAFHHTEETRTIRFAVPGDGFTVSRS